MEGYICRCFFYVQLLEKFRMDKKPLWFWFLEQFKIELETKLCTKNEHVIAKIYALFLKLETKEWVKECIIVKKCQA